MLLAARQVVEPTAMEHVCWKPELPSMMISLPFCDLLFHCSHLLSTTNIIPQVLLCAGSSLAYSVDSFTKLTPATHHYTRFGVQISIAFMQVLWISVLLIPTGWNCCCLYCVTVLCSVRLCEIARWEGTAQVLDWSCLNCQSSQRLAAERPPRNRLHWVHGSRHLAPCSLQRWT